MTDLIKQPKVQEAINLYATEPTITAQEVADKLGVSTALVYKWRQNPNFIEAYYDKYMVEFGGELPAVLQSMIREAKAGNVQAARLVLEHSGKLVKNINVTIDSPYEKFLKAEKAEIDYEDAEVEDIVDSIPDIPLLKEELPERKVENQHKRAVEEKKQIKDAINREEYNRKRREWHKWKKRAKAVGVEPLPARRPTPAQRKEWQDQIEQKEKQQR